MGSENVATVLRQSGASVRLVVARPVKDPHSDSTRNGVTVIPTDTLDEYLDNLFYQLTEMDSAGSLVSYWVSVYLQYWLVIR